MVLDGVPLEQVSSFKYRGSWITESAGCGGMWVQEWEWLQLLFGKIKN
jgi:hypothetical protein